ncbi:hypothetical protein KFK09_011847 [Dendrobium nobile]|uniref:Reverse transcriptase zinc-binding domain-containing protein n=1 Tax=Dendrobium nobile TaxID=94219 RepID=A0A8T3BDS1_DENNO|nr:hypothetical protein KFK09_011847 [Dendrobium nobile]
MRYAMHFSCYTYTALLKGLKTIDILSKWNLDVPLTFVVCSNDEENHNHIFFECDFSFSIIISSLVPCLHHFILRPIFLQVLDFNFTSNMEKDSKEIYSMQF